MSDDEARDPAPAERPPRFVDVLRRRDFAVLYTAETISIAGDQLARVALSLLVFRQTGSALATALTYAATFLPAIAGGALLGRLGDRLPRRLVMVGCDVVRAALFAAMAVPGLPLGAVVGLLVVAVFVGPGFTAAEVSHLAAVLVPEEFRSATGLRMITSQVAQVGGFALGGVAVAVLGPRPALLVDAASFAFSALVIGLALQGRSGGLAGTTVSQDSASPASAASAFRVLWTDPRRRSLMALSALAGFFVVPEGLAVPLAAHLGVGAVRAGLLLASIPLGAALGIAVLVRLRPARRGSTARVMAVACGVPLLLTVLTDSWTVVFVAWIVSGLLSAYQMDVTTNLVQLIPVAVRSRGLGLAGAILISAQGIGLAAFGAVAGAVTAQAAIAVAGAAGSAIAAVIVLGVSRREHAERGRHVAPSNQDGRSLAGDAA